MATPLKMYRSDTCHSSVATIGGGITTDQILQALRILYMGGVKCDKKIAQHITCGAGPSRFFSCLRYHLKPEAAPTTLVQDVLTYLQDCRDGLTYEVGLRWFLNSPGEHLPQADRSRRIAILPPQPLIIDGKPQVMLFYGGGDGPGVHLVGVELERPWPDWDFLLAREIVPNPYSH